MLRFLTHKLKTQSLNEVDNSFQHKSDDDRDSGTESDDENTEFEDSQENMDNVESVNNVYGDIDDENSCTGRHSTAVITASKASSIKDHSVSDVGDVSGGKFGSGTGGVFGVNLRRRAFARRSMDASISSSCHSTNSASSNTILMANGNSSDVDDFTALSSSSSGVGTLEKHVPSPVSAMLDVDSALPSDSDHFDHHSSEEELEVINSSRCASREDGSVLASDEEVEDDEDTRFENDHHHCCDTSVLSDECRQISCRSRQTTKLRTTTATTTINATTILSNSSATTCFKKLKYKCNKSITFPEISSPNSHSPHQLSKKSFKKPDLHHHHHHHHQQQQQQQQQPQHHPHSSGAQTLHSTSYHPEKRKWSQANRRSFGESSAGSSDEEVRDLMCSPSAPVEFRTSPPAELLRPTRSTTAAGSTKGGTSMSPHQPSTTASPSLVATVMCAMDVGRGGVGEGLVTSSSPSTMLIHGAATAINSSAANGNPSRSPPTKLFHFSSSNFTPFEVCAVSPRKRHRQTTSAAYHHHHHPHHPYHPQQHVGSNGVDGEAGSGNGGGGSAVVGGNIHNQQSNSSRVVHPVQRPCLDFEKMQQVGKTFFFDTLCQGVY